MHILGCLLFKIEKAVQKILKRFRWWKMTKKHLAFFFLVSTTMKSSVSVAQTWDWLVRIPVGTLRASILRKPAGKLSAWNVGKGIFFGMAAKTQNCHDQSVDIWRASAWEPAVHFGHQEKGKSWNPFGVTWAVSRSSHCMATHHPKAELTPGLGSL